MLNLFKLLRKKPSPEPHIEQRVMSNEEYERLDQLIKEKFPQRFQKENSSVLIQCQHKASYLLFNNLSSYHNDFLEQEENLITVGAKESGITKKETGLIGENE